MSLASGRSEKWPNNRMVLYIVYKLCYLAHNVKPNVAHNTRGSLYPGKNRCSNSTGGLKVILTWLFNINTNSVVLNTLVFAV